MAHCDEIWIEVSLQWQHTMIKISLNWAKWKHAFHILHASALVRIFLHTLLSIKGGSWCQRFVTLRAYIKSKWSLVSVSGKNPFCATEAKEGDIKKCCLEIWYAEKCKYIESFQLHDEKADQKKKDRKNTKLLIFTKIPMVTFNYEDNSTTTDGSLDLRPFAFRENASWRWSLFSQNWAGPV